MNITREELEALLSDAFDEGMSGFLDLKAEYIADVVEKFDCSRNCASSNAYVAGARDAPLYPEISYSSRPTPDPVYTRGVNVSISSPLSATETFTSNYRGITASGMNFPGGSTSTVSTFSSGTTVVEWPTSVEEQPQVMRDAFGQPQPIVPDSNSNPPAANSDEEIAAIMAAVQSESSRSEYAHISSFPTHNI